MRRKDEVSIGLVVALWVGMALVTLAIWAGIIWVAVKIAKAAWGG